MRNPGLRVLILGGGDGGVATRVLKHRQVLRRMPRLIALGYRRSQPQMATITSFIFFNSTPFQFNPIIFNSTP